MDEFEEKATALEALIIQKISKSISAAELAVCEWEATKPKPENGDVGQNMEHVNFSYPLLVDWSKKSLVGKKNRKSFIERFSRFREICRMLEERSD